MRRPPSEASLILADILCARKRTELLRVLTETSVGGTRDGFPLFILKLMCKRIIIGVNGYS